MESANEAVRTLPVTCPQRQAANDRRHGDCPRAVGVHLGDQSRDHGENSINVVRDRGALDRSTAPPLRLTLKRDSRRHHRAGVRAGPRQGNSRTPICGRSLDRCPILDRDSPRRKNGNAVTNPRIRACRRPSAEGYSLLAEPGPAVYRSGGVAQLGDTPTICDANLCRAPQRSARPITPSGLSCTVSFVSFPVKRNGTW